MDTTSHTLPYRVLEVNDQQAFEDLYRTYFVRLYRFCFSIVHQKEPAEEIVHDVFMNLWKRRSSLSEITNLEVYLYVSVKHLSLNYVRNDRIHIVDIESRMNDYIEFSADPETLMVSAKQLGRIRRAIDQLSPRCKLIFSLVKEDGLKYKDVAQLLELSIKTVEAQLAIAVKKIALALQGV